MITADTIIVDDDEGRFVLKIITDDLETITVDIHQCVLSFYADVRSSIGPYAAEAESARRAVATPARSASRTPSRPATRSMTRSRPATTTAWSGTTDGRPRHRRADGGAV